MSKLLYTHFTKLIIEYILLYNKSIPRRSDSKLHNSQDDHPITKLLSTTNGDYKFGMEVPDAMISDAIKKKAGQLTIDNQTDEIAYMYNEWGQKLKGPAIQSLLDLRKGLEASRLESLRKKKQLVAREGSSATYNKYYSSSDTDSDATLYSSTSDKPKGSVKETDDADESDMDLSNDNPDGDDDDARCGVFMHNKSTTTPNSTYLNLMVTSFSLDFIQTLLDETPANELTDFMSHPKDELTIAVFKGTGLELLKVQYNNDVELEYHVNRWEKDRIDFFKAGMSVVTKGNIYPDLRIKSILSSSCKEELGGNKRLKGRDWIDYDVKSSREMLKKIDEILRHKERLRRLEEYVGGISKTVNPMDIAYLDWLALDDGDDVIDKLSLDSRLLKCMQMGQNEAFGKPYKAVKVYANGSKRGVWQTLQGMDVAYLGFVYTEYWLALDDGDDIIDKLSLDSSPDQTVSGKDLSNPLMADNLSKFVWYSTHHFALMKSWLVQKQRALGQTTTGKEISNLFMAGVNTPRCDKDKLELIELTVFLLPNIEKVKVEVSAVDLQVFAVRPIVSSKVSAVWSDELMLPSHVKTIELRLVVEYIIHQA
nr:hypothetical protein [Tanacetum cinerariifolium]